MWLVLAESISAKPAAEFIQLAFLFLLDL